MPVNIPLILDDPNPEKPYSQQPSEERILTEQEVLDYLGRLEERLNRVPTEAPPALLLLDELGVCPQSMIDVDISNILNLQAQCAEYHVAPYHSVWMKNPNVVVEAFESVKEGQALYTRYSFADIENKDKQKNKIPIGAERRRQALAGKQ